MKVNQLVLLPFAISDAVASAVRSQHALEHEHEHHALPRALCPPILTTIAIQLQPVYYSEQFPYNTVIYPFHDGNPFTVTDAPTVVIIQSTITQTFTQTIEPGDSSTSKVPTNLGSPAQYSSPTVALSGTQSAATTNSATGSQSAATTISAPGAQSTTTTNSVSEATSTAATAVNSQTGPSTSSGVASSPQYPLSFGDGLPAGTFTDFGNTFVILAFGYLAQALPKARRNIIDRRQQGDGSSPVVAVNFDATQGLQGGVTQDDCDSATPLFLQNGTLVNFNRSVGKNLGATTAELRLLTSSNTVVDQTFGLDNGILDWNATDLGTAKFFDCSGVLVAAFAVLPSGDCIPIRMGLVAGSTCRDRVSQTRSVNPTFTGPASSASSSSTSFPAPSQGNLFTKSSPFDSTSSGSEPSSSALSAMQTTTSTVTSMSFGTTNPSRSSSTTVSSYSTTVATVEASSSSSITASSITSSTTACPVSSVSSCIPVSSSAVVLPPPAQCNNFNFQYAVYANPFKDTDPPEYSNADPAYFQYKSPQTQGVYQPVGFSCPDSSMWCTANSFDPASVAINQRGYLYVPVTGIYTFTVTRANDIGFLWLGSTALSGWNRGNAAIVLGGGTCSSSEPIYVPLVAGQYFPIRLLTLNDLTLPNDPLRAFKLRIVRPDCQVLLDYNSMPTSNYFFQFSCDGASGTFPPFGAGG